MFRRKEEDMDNKQLAFENDNQQASEAEPYAQQPESGTQQEDARPSPAAVAASEANAKPTPRPAPSQPAAFRPQPSPATAPIASARAPIAANSSEIRTPSPAAKSSSKRILTVGNDIHMKGEINTCDRLVIEGIVDATLRDVHTVELAETGSLRGTAEVEDAEISGYFEGDLTVTGRLIIYASGTVRGNVTYGEIEIERGGQLSGSIAQVSEAASADTKKQKKAA